MDEGVLGTNLYVYYLRLGRIRHVRRRRPARSRATDKSPHNEGVTNSGFGRKWYPPQQVIPNRIVINEFLMAVQVWNSSRV